MTALAAVRDTKEMASIWGMEFIFAVEASVVIYQGAMVTINAAGYLIPATTATDHKGVCFRAEESVTGTTQGALNCRVRQGIFKYAAAVGSTIADLGAVLFITDDQSVSDTDTSQSVAGRLVKVDTDGVWVLMGFVTKASDS